MASKVMTLVTSPGDASHDDFSLRGIQVGRQDKLGNPILEILWLSPDYAIYRTPPGIFVHFSDNKVKEQAQRVAFTTICPELCELRFLTNKMYARRWHLSNLLSGQPLMSDDSDRSLFNHNIAQSIMLLMEDKVEDAKEIATAALDMAVARTTNDNTIRYLRWALLWAVLVMGGLGLFYLGLEYIPIMGIAEHSPLYLVACFYGVVGGCFSIITRVQSFEMKPCEQSNMNKWMALIRVMIGLIGGFAFFLLARSSLGAALINAATLTGWQGAALLGFLGGFAERMVQTVMQRTATGLEEKTGTPVQRARGKSRNRLV